MLTAQTLEDHQKVKEAEEALIKLLVINAIEQTYADHEIRRKLINTIL